MCALLHFLLPWPQRLAMSQVVPDHHLGSSVQGSPPPGCRKPLWVQATETVGCLSARQHSPAHLDRVELGLFLTLNTIKPHILLSFLTSPAQPDIHPLP